MNAQNIPIQTTSFVGREKELAEIAQLFSNPACRLLTLVGLGGIGKTRLAYQAATYQFANFTDGVSVVALAPLNSAEMLATAMLGAFNVPFYLSEDPRIQLLHYLANKQILLVMDNFDRLLDGAGLLTAILQTGRDVKILVTSRERLNLQEEWLFAVDGLAFPTYQSGNSLESYGAVELFVQRAQQLQPNFSLSEHAEAVRTICQQVAGMPLGLELAASWLRVMSCAQISLRMEASLKFLSSPLRNLPERHRSLRAVFDQSWDLLSPSENDVLMRLSVFRGGFDWEAGEQVAGASLSILVGLVDKSLVRLNAAGRYDLHELVGQYSAEKLRDLGETNKTADRHASYFLRLAEGAEAHAFGREQIVWFDRLVADFDNLRTALAWSEGTDMGLRLAGSLSWFFSERAYWAEGLHWLERMLTTTEDGPAALRAKVLHGAGALAGLFVDTRRAHAYCEQALTLARAENDRWNMAWALSHLGLWIEDGQSAAICLEESLALFRTLDDPMGISHTLLRCAFRAINRRDFGYARQYVEEGAVIASEAGDVVISAWVASVLGRISWLQDHNINQAKIHLETSLSLFREARFQVSTALELLAGVEQELGNLTRAQTLYGESLVMQGRLSTNYISILAGLAHLAIKRQQLGRAATLMGFIDRSAYPVETYWPGMIDFERDRALVRAQFDEIDFAQSLARGNAFTDAQVLAYALDDESEPTEVVSFKQTYSPTTAPVSASLLKRRELDILRLLAKGLSNREIAAQLVLAPSTVKWYLSEIYSKLDVVNRTQAEIRAREMALVD